MIMLERSFFDLDFFTDKNSIIINDIPTQTELRQLKVIAVTLVVLFGDTTNS